MASPKRVPRPPKFDSITYPSATGTETRVHYALAPFQNAIIETDRKWGIDRLPELVSSATAEKYGSAMAKLNAAIEANDPAATVERAAVCIRGLGVMDAEAEALGATKASTEVWEFELDGINIGIFRDIAHWQTIKAARPDLMLFSLREAAIALQQRGPTGEVVAEVKKHFPAAKVVRIDQKTPIDWKNGDDIGF